MILFSSKLDTLKGTDGKTNLSKLGMVISTSLIPLHFMAEAG